MGRQGQVKSRVKLKIFSYSSGISITPLYPRLTRTRHNTSKESGNGYQDNKSLYSRMKFPQFSAIREECESLIHAKISGFMVIYIIYYYYYSQP